MSVSYTLSLDHADLTRVGLNEAQAEVTDICRRVLNRANVLTPVDTGLLRSHNQMRVQLRGNTAYGEVFNDTAYALAVHDGTKPYTIRPVRAKVLRFEVGGEVVFARSVRHPGKRGRPWLKRALEEVARPLGYTMIE